MSRPQELVDAVIRKLDSASELPDKINYLDHVADFDTEAVKLPIVQVTTGQMTDENLKNKDFIEFVEDDDGNVTAKKFERLYRLIIEVEVFSAEGSSFDERDLGTLVRDELYKLSTSGAAERLLDENSDILDEVWKVSILSAEQTDDLSTSPPLRRWSQTIAISSSEEYIEPADNPSASGANTDINAT